MNFNESNIRLFNHFHINHIDEGPYPYIMTWEERMNAMRSGVGGNKAQGDDEDDEDEDED